MWTTHYNIIIKLTLNVHKSDKNQFWNQKHFFFSKTKREQKLKMLFLQQKWIGRNWTVEVLLLQRGAVKWKPVWMSRRNESPSVRSNIFVAEDSPRGKHISPFLRSSDDAVYILEGFGSCLLRKWFSFSSSIWSWSFEN